MQFESTGLWLKTLGVQENDQWREHRERLRAALLSFRDRAAMLAAEIARDLPDYTVHDVTHLDALWRMADLAGGPDAALNPAEGFVLGGAFLIHDLGNGLAAYPGGIGAMRASPEMRDAVATILRSKLGRVPSPAELEAPGIQTEKEATGQVLRMLHAQHAEQLALVSWRDVTTGLDRFLIEDVFLRETYGALIGRVAHSHWWAVDKLRQEFDPLLGAPANFPPEWTVDPLKLACLLRVADAGHLDSGRAPAFLKTIRRPEHESLEHWIFQEKLQQPMLSGDRLVYTSARPFPATEAPAWWLCFDTLQMLDKELTGVDAVLADCGRKRLAARGVQGAESPNRIRRWVQTTGWEPVDTKIRVTDVAALAAKLGGVQLYGDNKTVPLRELIQNASDAVRARRFLEARSADFGNITIRMGRDARGHWVEVEDNGVGMTKDIMAGPLLDFGEPFWGSQRMAREFPGLAASQFESTGKYGIGFFSIFMWGQRVRVISRNYRDAQRETHILEFSNGPRDRPLLRNAESSEFLKEGGTVTRVWLESPPESYGGVLHFQGRGSNRNLQKVCQWLCPALDTNLYIERDAAAKRVVSASDWKSMKGRELLMRVWREEEQFSGLPESRSFSGKELMDIAAPNLRDLRDAAGGVIGRAAVFPVDSGYRDFRLGSVTVGGFHACGMRGIAGILEGAAYTAARDMAIPVVPKAELAAWASGQAPLVLNFSRDPALLSDCAATILACGGSSGTLPVAETVTGWISIEDIRRWQSVPDEILILQEEALSLARREHGPINLAPNVVACNVGRYGILEIRDYRRYLGWPHPGTPPVGGYWWFHENTIEGAIVKAFAEGWGVSPDEVIAVSDISSDEESFDQEVGTAAGKPLIHSVNVLRNPHRHNVKGDHKRKSRRGPS